MPKIHTQGSNCAANGRLNKVDAKKPIATKKKVHKNKAHTSVCVSY